MGMGEPLANYDNLLKALRILNAPWGGGIGARKITISTSGLAPQIRQLADEPLQFRLAISLARRHRRGAQRIMPVNRKYPLQGTHRRLRVLPGEKEADDHVRIHSDRRRERFPGADKPLAALASRLFAKVNLIPYNKVEGLPWERPDEKACEAFLRALKKQQVTATLRREKGHDIDAACGQLRLKTERELAGAV